MQKSKLKRIIIISLLIVVGGVVIWMILWSGSPLGRLLAKLNDEGMTSSEEIAKIITETKPTDIIIRGDIVNFEEDITYRNINEINKEAITSPDEFEYTILVVNDVYNNVVLSEEEQVCIENAIKNEGFCLIYLGEKYADRWENDDTAVYSVEGNIQYSFFTLDNKLQKRIGMLNVKEISQLEEYPHMLGEVLLYCFSFYLEDVN